MSTRWIAMVLLLPLLAGGILLLPANAEAKKRRPPNNEICFDPALTPADRSDCKKQYANATTAAERDSIHKTFKRRVAAAKSAAQPHS